MPRLLVPLLAKACKEAATFSLPNGGVRICFGVMHMVAEPWPKRDISFNGFLWLASKASPQQWSKNTGACKCFPLNMVKNPKGNLQHTTSHASMRAKTLFQNMLTTHQFSYYRFEGDKCYHFLRKAWTPLARWRRQEEPNLETHAGILPESFHAPMEGQPCLQNFFRPSCKNLVYKTFQAPTTKRFFYHAWNIFQFLPQNITACTHANKGWMVGACPIKTNALHDVWLSTCAWRTVGIHTKPKPSRVVVCHASENPSDQNKRHRALSLVSRNLACQVFLAFARFFGHSFSL